MNTLLVKVLAIVVLISSIVGYIGYQHHTNTVQAEKIAALETKNTDLETKVSNLSKQIVGVTSLVVSYRTTQLDLSNKQDKLYSDVSRFKELAKAKPGLLAKKIETSYNKFHREKACISGNTEACNENTRNIVK